MKNDIIEKTKILRLKTGISIIACKNALLNNNGDIEKAILELRKKGIIAATLKSLRNTREGLIGILITDDRKNAIITEINCETDFVAKSDDFKILINKVNNYYLNNEYEHDDLNFIVDNQIKLPKDLEEDRLSLINKLGENILVKRLKKIKTKENYIFSYIHGVENFGRIATLLVVDKFINDYSLLYTDIAMQITAMNPKYISKDNIPLDILEQEKSINKNLNSFFQNDVLLEQTFIKDNNFLIKDIILDKFNIINFIRFEVGENIA